jgi:hypothetical protein
LSTTIDASPLTGLATELQRQLETKRDIMARTTVVSLDSANQWAPADVTPNTHMLVDLDGVEEFGITRHAHQQISDFAGVPWKLYERLLTKHPDLLWNLTNGLFAREPKKRMIRVLDGEVRAFLSDRYRRRDNWDLLEQAVLPELQAYSGSVMFKECSLTDTRMYVKVVFPDIEAPVTPKVGDVVRAGLIIQNSEVGSGALGIFPYTDRLICTNGMVHTDFGQRSVHAGRNVGGNDEEAYDLYSDETLRLDDEAFFSKCRDTIRNVVNEAAFEQIVGQMRDLSEIRMPGDPRDRAEELAKRHDLNEAETGSMLEALIEGGDLSAWGYVNSLTQTARDLDDADRRVDLEKLAGKLTSDPAWATAVAA